jgi:hypothetical protein
LRLVQRIEPIFGIVGIILALLLIAVPLIILGGIFFGVGHALASLVETRKNQAILLGISFFGMLGSRMISLVLIGNDALLETQTLVLALMLGILIPCMFALSAEPSQTEFSRGRLKGGEMIPAGPWTAAIFVVVLITVVVYVLATRGI